MVVSIVAVLAVQPVHLTLRCQPTVEIAGLQYTPQGLAVHHSPQLWSLNHNTRITAAQGHAVSQAAQPTSNRGLPGINMSRIIQVLILE